MYTAAFALAADVGDCAPVRGDRIRPHDAYTPPRDRASPAEYAPFPKVL